MLYNWLKQTLLKVSLKKTNGNRYSVCMSYDKSYHQVRQRKNNMCKILNKYTVYRKIFAFVFTPPLPSLLAGEFKTWQILILIQLFSP